MTDPYIDVGASADHPATSLLYAGRPPDLDHHWVAEIVWDQHDPNAVFRAVARSDETTEAVVAQSRPVEWPPSGAAAVQEMRDAVAELEAILVRAGWSAAGRGRAWYAKRFAWQPVPVRSTPAPPAVTPEDFEERWRCEIRWASGYVHSRFVAVRYAPGASRGVDLASSPDFRWMFKNEPNPQLVGDRDAVQQLCEALVANGWQPVGRGRTWYAQRFIWPGDGEPPERLDPVHDAVSDERANEERRVAARGAS